MRAAGNLRLAIAFLKDATRRTARPIEWLDLDAAELHLPALDYMNEATANVDRACRRFGDALRAHRFDAGEAEPLD